MEPGEALGIAAQVAVALAGFAGMVVVFRREAVHEWSGIDKLRLRLLLANSILPLSLCMVGLVLLTVEPMPRGIWKWCSGLLLIATISFVTASMRSFRRLNIGNQQRRRATLLMFYLFGPFGMAVMCLQLFNIGSLGAFWPFFAGIVYQLVTAMVQFARMILLLPD